MNRPWMPLYIADYLADTAHLNAAQSGAYLHLIMHYWQGGGLPDDDQALARIGRMTPAEWRKAKPTIAAFFAERWTHKRIDEELAHVAEVSSKRRASAEHMHSKRNANASANAYANGHAKDDANGVIRARAQHSHSQTERTLTPENPNEDTPNRGISRQKGPYAFESGVIRLNAKDLDQWRKAFPNLSLEAEMIALAPWAEQQASWFNAVAGALAKKQREALLAIERVKAEAGSRERPLRSDEWDRGL